jgi:hypothetical protein
MRRGIVAFVLPLALVGSLAVARADEVDDRGRDLTLGDPFKVRLTAALWLAQRPPADGRAVSLLVDAMMRDREPTVRRVAAQSLGKLVDEVTPSAERKRALSALEKAVAADRSRAVRRDARRALARIRGRIEPGPADSADGHFAGVFVHVGVATDVSRRLPREALAAVEAAMRSSLARAAPHFGVSRQGVAGPSGEELRAARRRGFYAGAAIAELETTRRGSSTDVRCKVTVRVTAWGGEGARERIVGDEAATASGTGRVSTGSSSLGATMRECAIAVVDEVVTRQVVPFLRRFEGRARR